MPDSSALDVPRDGEGYLIDPADWTEDIAQALAAAENITLGTEHWSVIEFMRDFLRRKGMAPDARYVIRHLKDTTGAPRNRLFELFPYGYVQQACKIAGMRRPRGWSTG
ncbi:MAG: TusE/DsrC/DsvC family sulfur relay protein [Rhodospirillaceae bacterium]